MGRLSGPRRRHRTRHHRAEHDLGPDAVAERAEEVGELEDARGQDHRCREQEGEAERVFAPTPARMPAAVVMPDREMPGARAAIWTLPMASALPNDIRDMSGT